MRRGAGLKPISDKRRRKLAAEGNPFPISTFTRTPMKATKRADSTGFDRHIVDAILDRDGQSCVRCGGNLWGERGLDYSIQHRRARGAGGSQLPDTNAPQNGIAMCGSGAGDSGCHSYVESHRDEARDHGWAVRQGKDPLRVAVDHFLHGLVFLYSNGSWGSRPERKCA